MAGKGRGRLLAPGRKAAAKSKVKTKLAKAVQKKAQKEAKNQAKQESKVSGHFQKAMNTYFERTIQEDRQYVLGMLAENDAWVPRLAALFRCGAMKTLLETGEMTADPGAGDPDEPRWKGKVYKLLSLPLQAKLAMVKPYVKLPVDDETDAGGAWLDQVMKYLFHIDDLTPLPKHENIRSYKILEAFAKARIDEIGQNRLKGKDLVFGKKDDLAFYALDETDPSILKCQFVPNVSARLPDINGVGTKWTLSNPYDPNCEVVCDENHSITFQCSSFFAVIRFLDTKRWTYVLDLEEGTKEDPGTSAGSGAASARLGLTFPVSKAAA